MLPPPSDLPWLARGRGCSRIRARSQTLPVKACLSNIPGYNLHLVDFRAGLGVMAAYSFCCSLHNSTRPRQRQRTVRSWHSRHGAGMVQLRTLDHSNDRPAGHDPEHKGPGRGLRRLDADEKFHTMGR